MVTLVRSHLRNYLDQAREAFERPRVQCEAVPHCCQPRKPVLRIFRKERSVNSAIDDPGAPLAGHSPHLITAMRNCTLAGDEVPPGSAVYHTQREQAGVAIEVRCRTRSERT